MLHATQLKCNHCIVPSKRYKSIEMHVFADSSKNAYTVVCFCRIIYGDHVVLNFWYGKNKVCPVNGSLTIPKLELVAAILASRAAQYMVKELPLEFSCIIY